MPGRPRCAEASLAKDHDNTTPPPDKPTGEEATSPPARKKAARRTSVRKKVPAIAGEADAGDGLAKKPGTRRKATRKKAVRRKPAAAIDVEEISAFDLDDEPEAAETGTEREPGEPRRAAARDRRPTRSAAEVEPDPDLIRLIPIDGLEEDEVDDAADRLIDAANEGPDDDDEPDRLESLAELGAVFTGEVPLDTPEQRLEAMGKAAHRLGIPKLHPEQEQVIDSMLRGNDLLMVLPTGFGKSACYQIPSMILPKPVVVISPLLALMRDQYEKLDKLKVPCARIDGTVRGGARKQALARIAAGERVLVMTTPETLAAPDLADALVRGGVSMAAVDEAHCISEWGFDFRPAYLQIGERLKAFGSPPVLALTATATEKVRLAIQRFVGMREPEIVASSPHRDNLAFDVLHCGGGARHRALVRLALRVRRPGIIYCSTTREVDEIYTVLQRFGIPSHRYHGKMNSSERAKQQDAFMQRGRRTVMVATNAFGLGIDKPDIRYIMHYQSPASLEQYVQEAGRSGRDGRRSNCIMLFSHEDRTVHEALLSRSRVRPEQLYKLGRALAAWASEEKVPSLQALALSAELGTRTVGALLALLEESTLVRWDTTAVHVTVPADEIEERSRTLAGQFETLRTQDAQRLDSVAEYAYTEKCRAVFLSEYFGEEGQAPCGMCDRCRGQEDRPTSFWQPLTLPKGEVARRGRARKKTARNGRGRKKTQRRRRRPGGRRNDERDASAGGRTEAAPAGRHPRDGRDPRESRNSHDGRDTRESRNSRDGRDTRDNRNPRDGRDPRENQEAREANDRRRSRRRRGRRGGRGRGRARRPEDGDSPNDAPPG